MTAMKISLMSAVLLYTAFASAYHQHFNHLTLGNEQPEYENALEMWNYEAQNGTCRFSNDLNLPPDLFSLFACATCYRHIDIRLFEKGSKLTQKGIGLLDPKTNETHIANVSIMPEAILKSFSTKRTLKLWVECCRSADACCRDIFTLTTKENSSFCPSTWDGWQCWKDTPFGTVAQESCPWHVYFHSEPSSCIGIATKICLPNGLWYTNEWKNEWSNFTACGRTQDIIAVLSAHVYSMSISVAFLIPALLIFVFYKQLQVFRVRMHKNLFVSLLLNAIFVISFERHFMHETLKNNVNSSLEANLIECRVIYTLTKYFRLCTYMWMLCEGFYLHKLITAAFAEQKNMYLFYALGWGFPMIPVTIWGSLRHIYADHGCWTVPYEHFEWILFSPMLIAIVVNFCFLINIIRILVMKLKSTHAKEPTQFRRAVKATLVLVPLFGLHFLLVMYHPDDGRCGFLHVYNIVTYCVDGLQGTLVSVIFCYCNNEVFSLVKRTYTRQRLVHSVGSQSNSRKANFESRMSISTNAPTIMEISSKRSSK